MHDDGIVGTFVSAVGASDAEVVIYHDHLADIGTLNSAGRAADQANRVFAMVAGASDEKVFILFAFAYKAGSAAVCAGATSHTIIAARANIQIHDKDTVALHQAFPECKLDQVRFIKIFSCVP